MPKAKRSGRKRVTLEYNSDGDSDIYVAGTFNNWNVSRKKMRPAGPDGSYEAVLMLLPGEHQYKFIVNGVWQLDPANPNWTPNGMGSLNSVLNIE